MQPEIATMEQLVAQGGRFYATPDGYYCDGGSSSWRWMQGVGFVRIDGDRQLPAPRIRVEYPLRRSHHREIETALA